MVTLSYLATGQSFKSLAYSTRIAQCTLSKFIPEVLSAINEELRNTHFKVPLIPQEWEKIATNFNKFWNIPNTIGAMHGEHIVFRAPRSAGSHYCNYKGTTHSIVLLAVVDSQYKFIYIDVGVNGRISDGGVFVGCDFANGLATKQLCIPNDKPLSGMTESVPYVIVADAAFPLQRYIIKPYPMKNLSENERIFNYRIKRVVENAFGILANRFRMLLSPINLARVKVISITQACCTLHNFIKMESPTVAANETDYELENDQLQLGSWRNDINTLRSVNLRRGRPNNAT